MKCVGIQHLEAVWRLKSSGKRLKRTIHLSYVPDEEIGGKDGMESFVKTSHFDALNIGFALDEGLASPGDACMAYYGERAAWWIAAETKGITGHGSQLFRQTAVDQLLHFLQKYVDWRQTESDRLHAPGSSLKLGDVTTVNINMIKAGAFSEDGITWQNNIIPSSAKAGVDMRIAPHVDLKQLEKELYEHAAQYGVEITILQAMRSNPVTSTDPNQNPWFAAFHNTCSKFHLKTELAIFPAATDARFLRAKGIPAIGFSPMNHTPVLLHDHNEFLNEHIFLKGLDFFTALVECLGSLGEHIMDK